MLSVVLIFISLLLFLFLHMIKWPSLRTFWYAYKLPGPKGLPLLGVSLHFIGIAKHELLGIYLKLSSPFPRMANLWLSGLPHVFLKEPEDIEVAFGSMQHITKGQEYSYLTAWLGDGLLLSTGNKWRSRRKMLTPAFHFKILEDSLQTLNRNALILTKKMLSKNGQPIDIEAYVKLCTLDVICESTMGIALEAQKDQAKEYVSNINRVNDIIIERKLKFWEHKEWMFNISPIGCEFRKMLKILHKFTEKVIKDRKQSFTMDNQFENKISKRRRAFLDLMIDHQASNQDSLTNLDMREEVDTFMFEGHDTTASALIFTMFLLGHDQDVQKKAVSELFEIFGESDRAVEMKDFQQMKYLEMVIKEGLRLFPSVPYVSRTLTHDLNLDGGVLIPAGVNLAVMIYCLHRNTKYFPDPEQFDPERFSEEASQNRHPYAYIPFSAGPRNCIGQKFAMMEMKATLSTILRKGKLVSITKREEVKPIINIITRSQIPIMIKLLPRDSLSP